MARRDSRNSRQWRQYSGKTRRARKKKMLAVFGYYRYLCCFCYRELTYEEVTVEHSKPGNHEWFNLRPACYWCNQAHGGVHGHKDPEHPQYMLRTRVKDIPSEYLFPHKRRSVLKKEFEKYHPNLIEYGVFKY